LLATGHGFLVADITGTPTTIVVTIAVSNTGSGFERVVKCGHYGSNSPVLVCRLLQFQKRSQLFIGPDDEKPFVAIGVNNPNRSPLTIEG